MEQDGLALSFEKDIVSWVFKRESNNSLHSDEWFRLIQASCPFKDISNTLPSDYIRFFRTIENYAYSMNDLQNRQILNGPRIFIKHIQQDVNRRKRKKSSSSQKIGVAFVSGSLYQSLSKSNTKETSEYYKNYRQNYDNTLHEGLSDKAVHLSSKVVRASNNAVRNSKALTYPNDAFNYYCLLNTRDLKSAGEQNVLSDYVMMTEESNAYSLYLYIKTLANKEEEEEINNTNNATNGAANNCNVTTTTNDEDDVTFTRYDDNSKAIISIDGFLIDCKIRWNLQVLVNLKKRFPHVTSRYYLPYIILSIRSSISIKYSEEHDVFFSPAESTHFKITYPEADTLSVTAKQIDIHCLRKTPPSKTTVSLNNIRGSIAKVTSKFHLDLMLNSLGVTCYMDIKDEEIERLIDYAVISNGHDTSNFHKVYNLLCEEFQLNNKIPVPETNMLKAYQALARMYPPEHLLVECRKTINNTPFKMELCDYKKHDIADYYSTIFNQDLAKAPNVWNLKLRCAFGNPLGACNEDGVVIDSHILEKIPPIYYNACITVEFKFQTSKQPRECKFVSIDETHGNIRNETLIGCLITEHEVYVKHSKHSNVTMTKIGAHYYYFINFLPKEVNMYDKLNVRHIQNGSSIIVIITGQNEARVNVGSKIANAYGQKNIISRTTDKLPETCWGITRDGRKVHAQLVYSEVSLIGRIPSGQLYDMLTSPELAIGPNGELISTISIVIHTLHPYTNNKIFDALKVDTLTNINGFDSQGLSSTSNYLRHEKVEDKVIRVLSLHGYDVKFMNATNQYPITINKDNPYYNKDVTPENVDDVLILNDNASNNGVVVDADDDADGDNDDENLQSNSKRVKL